MWKVWQWLHPNGGGNAYSGTIAPRSGGRGIGQPAGSTAWQRRVLAQDPDWHRAPESENQARLVSLRKRGLKIQRVSGSPGIWNPRCGNCPREIPLAVLAWFKLATA